MQSWNKLACARLLSHSASLLQGWNKLSVELCTHARQGLTSNDFVMAAKINQLPMEDLLRKKKKKLADA